MVIVSFVFLFWGGCNGAALRPTCISGRVGGGGWVSRPGVEDTRLAMMVGPTDAPPSDGA